MKLILFFAGVILLPFNLFSQKFEVGLNGGLVYNTLHNIQGVDGGGAKFY